MKLPCAIVTLGTIRPEDRGAAFKQKKESLDILARLGVNPLDMPRTPYWASEGNTFKNPPCPITPPSRHHLYIIHLINGPHCFYCITMSLK